jgi:hypothetical protein
MGNKMLILKARIDFQHPTNFYAGRKKKKRKLQQIILIFFKFH